MPKPNAELLFNIAHEYIQTGNLRGGLRYAELSADACKDHPEPFCRSVACRRIASIHMTLGDFEQAEYWHRKAIKTNPREVFAYCGLSACKKYTKDDPLFADLEQIATSQHTTDSGKMHCYFALGKMYDDIQDYDTAWKYFQYANNLHQQPFPHEVYEAYVAELQHLLKDKLFCDYLGKHGLQDSDRFVFIIGMPRSGTTLLEQMLAQHSQIASVGELMVLPILESKLNQESNLPNLLGCRNLLQWNNDSIRKMADIYAWEANVYASKEARYIINKVPNNFIFLPLIKTLLPKAKIIHCTRDLRDVALSCYQHNFENYQEWSFREKGIVRYIENIYRPTVNNESLRKLFDAWIDINYERLVGDPLGEITQMLEYLELPWEDAVLNYRNGGKVSSASIWQVRQPLFISSIGRYKNYEKHITKFLSLEN